MAAFLCLQAAETIKAAPLLSKEAIQRLLFQCGPDPVAARHQRALAGGVTGQDQTGIHEAVFALRFPCEAQLRCGWAITALRAEQAAKVHDVSGAADGLTVAALGAARPAELWGLDLFFQLITQDLAVAGQDLRHSELQLIGIPAGQLKAGLDLNCHQPCT